MGRRVEESDRLCMAMTVFEGTLFGLALEEPTWNPSILEGPHPSPPFFESSSMRRFFFFASSDSPFLRRPGRVRWPAPATTSRRARHSRVRVDPCETPAFLHLIFRL